MQPNHLPALGPRYWSALCLASIFGANMGDFFARNLGLGHVSGLPFLAAALATVIVADRSPPPRIVISGFRQGAKDAETGFDAPR